MTKTQKKYSKVIWESQKPILTPTKRMVGGIEIESHVFVGFSKGKTYIKSIHGLIGSSVKN